MHREYVYARVPLYSVRLAEEAAAAAQCAEVSTDLYECGDVLMGMELCAVPNDLKDYLSSTTAFH